MIETGAFSSQEAIDLEHQYGAHNYHPLPVVLSKGEGVFLWDVEGNKYYDFLSAYSAVNQGHCHPRIVQAVKDQAEKLTLTSRAFHSDQLGIAEKYVCEYFGYDRALFMNTGVEANESAIKIARKWGYQKKQIPDNEAVIVVAENNFHGRTITIISASTDPVARNEFGPFTPGFDVVPYNDIEALETALSNPNVAGFLIEPIQGEAGVFVPDDGYLEAAENLCRKYNVLLMMDEVQTGIARTGKLLASQYEDVSPDMLILGKAVSGGVFPVSIVLSHNETIGVLKPGEHGSTYGGNPMACAVTMAALDVVKDEKLAENAAKMGVIFHERMNHIVNNSEFVELVRGRGLLNAIVIADTEESETAWNICLALKANGLLAKPTHGNIIRFAPPLVITEEQLHHCCDIIEKTLEQFHLT